IPALEKRVGVPVVPVQATKRIGISTLRRALSTAARFPTLPEKPIHFPTTFEQEVDGLQCTFPHPSERVALPRFLLERLLIDAGGSIEQELVRQFGPELQEQAQVARERLTLANAAPQHLEIDIRYRWITQVMDATVRQPLVVSQTWNDRIDYVVTHPV